jgi:hypothetical protein
MPPGPCAAATASTVAMLRLIPIASPTRVINFSKLGCCTVPDAVRIQLLTR